MSALWVFVPVLGAPIVHAPVLTFDLLRGLKRPLDFGATIGGRRLFGDNKTWRGALFMTGGVVVAAALLSLWPWYWHKLPDGIQDAGPWVYGLLLGVSVVVGELPNSFLKRQLGIQPGAQRRDALGIAISIFDQADFVPVAWVLLLPLWTMSLGQAVIVFAVVAAVHMVINVIGFAIGARSSPL
jgi:CDP-2,3-bis-(O-geranylgeranyl)-sn-glycerol synthase